MGPKIKITKKEILSTGFEIAKDCGLKYVTVRNVAKKLQCSTAPIYFNFKDVNDLKEHIIILAVSLFEKLILDQKTGNFLFDIELTTVVYARDYPFFYNDVVIKKHDLFKTIERIKSTAIMQLQEDEFYNKLDNDFFLRLMLKRQFFVDGLALSATEKKYSEVFTTEYIQELLLDAHKDFLSKKDKGPF